MEPAATSRLESHLLVVEDEYLVALDIQRGLERLGHDVVVAYSGDAAVAEVSRASFDLVLMDIKLGAGTDGIDAADVIRKQHDIPVIYLTAYADDQTLARARATEPYGYVLKPFQERELQAVIEMALQRHHHDRERRAHERLQQFLGDATRRLSATLDYHAVAAAAAELLVPRYADRCIIHLHERDDSVPAFRYARPEGDTSGDDAASTIIAGVLEGGGPVLLSNERGPRSFICVPIIVREDVLGALALSVGPRRPHYGAADLLLAEDFAQRLATTLDNALLYRRAERAIHMRDDVLAIVSHDLRTPLGAIMMQAESLDERHDLHEIGHHIARSAQRMNRLIGDLLDASALDAGRLTLDCRTCAVDEVLHEAVDMYRSQAAEHGIELVEQRPSPTARISCDADRIVQVLSNLISNALKFTPRGGRVVVEAVRNKDGIGLEVCDSGRGIEPDRVPYLFAPFWQARAQRHGKGLGLFVARGIVAAHGSSLELVSTLNEGSRFFFSLPEVRT